MAFDTKIIDVTSGPADLIADTDISAAITAAGTDGLGVFLQNVGTSTIRYQEGGTEPATSAKGHCLGVKDGFELRFKDGDPATAWVWTAATVGCVAVSCGS